MIETLITVAIRGLFAAAGTGVVVTWTWLALTASARRPVLPGRLVDRSPTPPWRSLTVLGAFLVYLLVCLGVAELYHVARARLQVHVHAQPVDAVAGAQANPPELATESLSNREQIGLFAVAGLILVVTLPLAVRWTSGARAADFGASWVNWKGQVALGFGAAGVTLPVCFLVQGLAIRVWTSNENKMATLLREHFSPGTAVLSLFSGVVLAPMIEEFLFRVLLQRWLIGLFHGLGRDLTAVSPIEDLGDPNPSPAPVNALEADSSGRISPFAWSWPTWLGILVTALGFAAVHAPQWPAPISLFVFAVAIGVVYQHSGSVLAAIIMHASLNAVSTLAMILQAMGGL